jgi:hypothetical protein
VAVTGFAARLFGNPTQPEFPSQASAVPAFLAACYRPWRDGIVGLDDGTWNVPLGSAWARYATSTHLDLALHVFDEVVHHAAEVALLRDLYLHRHA